MKQAMMAAGLALMPIFALTTVADEDSRAAQVYDIKVSVKTTQGKTGKISPKKNPFVSQSETVMYRKQASQTWTGVAWGCGCESAFGRWTTLHNDDIVAGIVIWNSKKPYDIVLLDDINWHVMNAIDETGNKCECAWTIGESDDDSAAFLAFSGFGSITFYGGTCGHVISSVSGNVAGWVPPPARKTTTSKPVSCTFCGSGGGEEETVIESAVAWAFCNCVDFGGGDDSFTAVSGTWSMKYNKSLSAKLMSKTSILDVYTKFPSAVKKAVSDKIAEVKGH